MRAIMADNDIQGQMIAIQVAIRSDSWREIWASLNLSFRTFQDLPLPTDASDAVVWHACQKEEIVLITGNRNDDGPDSLQATIQAHLTPTSLPVLTLSEPRKVMRSAEYTNRVVESLLQYLLDIDKARGTGRLGLP